MRDKTQSAIATAVLVLLLTALACTCTAPRPTIVPPTAAPQAGASAVPTLPSAPTDAVALTNTPVPDVPGPGDCSFNAKFVTDVTIPDGTVLSPDATFIKVWRMRNTGTCTWEAGTKLVFSSGDQMGGPSDVPVAAPVAPGAEVDISVNLKAPGTSGTYQGKWRLQNHTGTFFGSDIWVKIVVPGPATSTPTSTPLPGPMCTPPSCPAGQIAICPGLCTGGCGMVCVTPTSSGCVAVDPTLQPALAQAEAEGHDMGCPTGPAFNIQKDGGTGAFQEFWANWDNPNPHTHYRSLMIWRADTREIYVIDGQNTDASRGALLAYTDTWEEGQPSIHPDCAAMTPPSGYQLPVRGFGKVWCTQGLEDEVGWPSQAEVQVNLRAQPMQVGWLMKVSNPGGTSYLVALGNNWAVTQFTTP
jgi:hypothetical protein